MRQPSSVGEDAPFGVPCNGSIGKLIQSPKRKLLLFFSRRSQSEIVALPGKNTGMRRMVFLLSAQKKNQREIVQMMKFLSRVFASLIPNAIFRGVLFQSIDNELILMKYFELFRGARPAEYN